MGIVDLKHFQDRKLSVIPDLGVLDYFKCDILNHHLLPVKDKNFFNIARIEFIFVSKFQLLKNGLTG